MENLLDKLYAYNATIPSMVYFVRKMSEGKSSTSEVKQTLSALVDLLCDVPFQEFEAKNREYLYESNKCDFLNKKRNKVMTQLDEVRKLDQELTKAIIELEDKIHKLEHLKSSAVQHTNEYPATAGNIFESLFVSDPLFPPPLPLTRQTAMDVEAVENFVLSNLQD